MALVLGLAGLVTGLLVLSPFAWWYGKKTLNEIDANPGAYSNRGYAQGGHICGIIGTILLALAILFVIAMVVLYAGVLWNVSA
jgi:hypothetical protein